MVIFLITIYKREDTPIACSRSRDGEGRVKGVAKPQTAAVPMAMAESLGYA